jgi:hypothetical protein
MKKIFVVLTFLVSVSFSQSLLGVAYPTGISYPLSTMSARMSGVGTALKEPYLVSSLNPANLGSINKSVYSLSVNADYVRVHENDDYADFSSFSPAFIGFAFPMGKAGTLAASFKQNGSNKYSFQDTSHLINSVLQDTILVFQKFDNSVAFSAWEFGWGIEFLKKRLAIGATYQIGQYKNRMDRSNVMDTINVYSGLDSVYCNQSNSTVRGGISGNIKKFGAGFSLTYPLADDLYLQRFARELQQNPNGDYSIGKIPDSLVFKKVYKMQLPPSGNLGVSWIFSEKLKTAADLSITMWERYWTTAPLLEYSEGELANAAAISAGVEFIPQPNLLSSRYFQRVRYSGGISFRELPIDGDYEISFSAGLGLPLGNNGIVDVSVETGFRNSEVERDIRENFVRINFGMSGGQVWKKSSNNIY